MVGGLAERHHLGHLLNDRLFITAAEHSAWGEVGHSGHRGMRWGGAHTLAGVRACTHARLQVCVQALPQQLQLPLSFRSGDNMVELGSQVFIVIAMSGTSEPLR